MTLQELINLAGDRDLSKSYPKADGLYIWDYKLQFNENLELDLVLIPSDSGKTGFRDKVSVQELVTYTLSGHSQDLSSEQILSELQITGVEGITIAKV